MKAVTLSTNPAHSSQFQPGLASFAMVGVYQRWPVAERIDVVGMRLWKCGCENARRIRTSFGGVWASGSGRIGSWLRDTSGALSYSSTTNRGRLHILS